MNSIVAQRLARKVCEDCKEPDADVSVEAAVEAGAWLCGPPELVTERLMELQYKYPGLEQVNVGATAMSTQESVILEQLDLFGKEVMPTAGGAT